MKKTVVAFDFGASSGRAIAGTYQDGRLEYKEVHRFDNIPVDDDGRMCHNFPAICKEVDAALSKMNSADGLSFDTWGVDYGLLNKSGNLLRLPCHYRDTRTAGTVEKVLKKIPADNLYRATGNQIMEINTLFQLTTEDTAGAEKLLFMPDLFAHHLCGSMQTEPTIASTSQMLDPVNQTWRTDIAKACGIDPQLLPAVGPSATVLGKTGGGIQVIASAGHDTQCAVAAMPAAAGEQPAFLSCGTWSLIGCELDEPILTPESQADDLSNEQGANGKTNYLKNISGLWLIQETRRAYRRAGAEYSYNDLEQLARAAEPFAIGMELRGQQLQVVASGNVRCDPAWTAEALGNILKNCSEHMQEGTITVRAEENAVASVVVIRDTGGGIAPQDLPHLFERYYKGKNASAQSVGVGLALSRSIIAAQNGTVSAANCPGGAEFTVKFYRAVV